MGRPPDIEGGRWQADPPQITRATAESYTQRNYGGWCKCSECGATFGGIEGFDRHKVNMTGQDGYDPEYDWRCATEFELRAKGMHQDGRGWWVRKAFSAPRQTSLADVGT